MGENHPCSNRIKKGNGIDLGSCERKRGDSVSPMLRLITSCRDGSNH